MQRAAKCFVVLAGACTCCAALSQAPSDIPAMVGEMVRLESQKALLETQRAAGPGPAGAIPVSAMPAAKPRIPPPPPGNTDAVVLLGTYRRANFYAADIAINRVVSYVEAGDRIAGGYTVKSIGGNCVYLIDAAQLELMRCVFADTKN